MGVFEFVLVIVVLGIGSDMWSKHLKNKTKLQMQANPEKLDDVIVHLEKLEHRMRVVEEIVSSSSYELRQELSELEKPTGDRL